MSTQSGDESLLPTTLSSVSASPPEPPPESSASTPAESAAAAEPASPPAEGEPPRAPKIKIGSQRPGAGRILARPQVPVGLSPEESEGKKAKVRPPNLRAPLSAELEAEIQEALGGASLNTLVVAPARAGEVPVASGEEVAVEQRRKGRVVAVQGGDVFIQLGQRDQGTAPLAQFPQPPSVGTELEVYVGGYDAEDNLYKLSVPGAAVQVADWSDLVEGNVVMATVTGHNKGGLECQVNNLRGFIPASHAALYRVEDLSTLVGQKLACVVTEADAQKRNLVLSRRAVLEREQAEAKKTLLEALAPGQVREGVVRRIHDFGAFVDIGGVDGLLHVSRLSWGRVKHPSDVLKEGDKVRVVVEKIDAETKKISLSMRDFVENPWLTAEQRFPPRSVVRGRVTKVMDFGAFVELEPGVEGLVHISELARQRVFRTSDIVKEGQEVEVQILSVDLEKKRISLSMKALIPIEAPKSGEAAEGPAEEAPPPKRKGSSKPLRGGLGRSSGSQFGLNW
jgi:small subunit ribosomal protein S1